MDYEFRRAREKLERDREERKEKARQKSEKERKAGEEASHRRETMEAVRRSRRLDAIESQLLADRKVEEALLSGGGILFRRVLEASFYEGSGDKIKLPPSCFSELSDQGAFDGGSLHFKLSVTSGESEEKKTTHSGVLEFTAEEGSVVLPPHVYRNLNLPLPRTNPQTPSIEVIYARLPKGNYARLRAEEGNFFDLPDHRAVLETVLRRHATLSVNDTVTVGHGDVNYELRVLELRPSFAVSVLDTDIEVDIVSSGTSDVSSTTLKPLIPGKPEVGLVREGCYDYYKFSVGDVPGTDVEVRLSVEKTDAGDTDVYVSKHPLLFPSRYQHRWSSHESRSKSLILGGNDPDFGPGHYSVSVYGFRGETEYRISVNLVEGRSSVTPPPPPDAVECSHCRHHVPSGTLRLHEAYCIRHNVVCRHPGCDLVLRVSEAGDHLHCDRCGTALRRSDLDKHMKVFHEPLRCSCGVTLEKEEMVNHQATSCSLRLITCRFCGDAVRAGASSSDVRDRLRGLSEHESVCGSRTAPCDSCGRAVMLKEMEIHRIAVHHRV